MIIVAGGVAIITTIVVNGDYISYYANEVRSWIRAQILGKPTEKDGYEPPKNWDGKKVKNPNGGGSGYPDKNGDVWVPTDHKGTHAPHWDVQHPGGGHTPVYPTK